MRTGIPFPVSEKENCTCLESSRASMCRMQPAGLWRILLSIRLRKARESKSGSPVRVRLSRAGSISRVRGCRLSETLFIYQAARLRRRAAGAYGFSRRGQELYSSLEARFKSAMSFLIWRLFSRMEKASLCSSGLKWGLFDRGKPRQSSWSGRRPVS